MTAKLRYLSLGWGVQSFTLAAMMALDELPRTDFLIHADTHHEREGTYSFRRRWEPWLGQHGLEVVTVSGQRTDVVMANWGVNGSVMIPAFTVDQHGDPGQVRLQCTHDWKVMPARRFIRQAMVKRGLKATPGAVESWMGISWDEAHRVRDSDAAYITNVYPLIERRMTRQDCIAWLQAHSIEVPPKSACTFCPFRSIASWEALKRSGGADWQEAVAVDITIRDRRPGFALYVHPHRLPVEQAIRIPEDTGSRQLEMFEPEQPCDSGVCWT